MLKPILIASLVGATFLVGACKPGYNRIYDNSDPDDSPDCIESPISTNASNKTKEVFRLIADLSCDRIEDFTLVGQSLGAGNQIADDADNNHSYKALIDELFAKTQQKPAIISIDLEEVSRFSETNIDDARAKLKVHSDAGGIISITWTPINPWRNDTDQDPLAPTTKDEEKLSALYSADNSSDARILFDERLTLVANQLSKLSEAGIPVLFAPFPEMNGKYRWYADTSDNTETEFKELWNYVSKAIKDKNPTNLLWVYAPRSGNSVVRANAIWGYPGKTNIDIVAGISYSDELNIQDYEKYQDLEKPLGLTRLAPSDQIDGTFDNSFYSQVLPSDNPFIAYWIAEHDTPIEGESSQKRSIVNNENASTLMKNSKIATLSVVNSKEWIEP